MLEKLHPLPMCFFYIYKQTDLVQEMVELLAKIYCRTRDSRHIATINVKATRRLSLKQTGVRLGTGLANDCLKTFGTWQMSNDQLNKTHSFTQYIPAWSQKVGRNPIWTSGSLSLDMTRRVSSNEIWRNLTIYGNKFRNAIRHHQYPIPQRLWRINTSTNLNKSICIIMKL